MRILLALMALNAAAAIPISFYSVGLPTLLREAGVSLEVIGFTALVYLPFAFSFVWAPYVDRPNPLGFPRRRFWTAATLLPMGLLSLIGATLAPAGQVAMILTLAFVSSIGAATLRTTILGLAVESFEGTNRTWAAAFVPAGGALGALIGATGLLFIYGAFGWAGSMVAMALVLLLLMAPGLSLPETPQDKPVPGLPGALHSFFASDENRRLLSFVLPLAIGFGLGFGMMQPHLVDLGYSIEQIGVINGVFTCIALFTGGPLAAYGVRRIGLARMIPVGLFIITIALFYAALVSAMKLPRLHAAASVVIFYMAFSFVSVLTTRMFMDRSTPGREGTDFSIFLCAYWFASMIGIFASGLIAGQLGYAAAFGSGAGVVACAGFLTHRLRIGTVTP